MIFFNLSGNAGVQIARRLPVLILLLAALTGSGCRQISTTNAPVDDCIALENQQVRLEVSRSGGMFTGFVVRNNPVNPFGWALTVDQMPENNRPFVFKGHFLCTGRWGAPTPGEIKAGIPHNGEVNTVVWEVADQQVLSDETQQLVMESKTPLERLDVRRRITLQANASWFFVEETFTNNLPIGRPVNFVQHVTVGKPFITKDMVVNSNASWGFDQRTPWTDIEESSFSWPKVTLASGSELDLQVVSLDEGFVTSHVFPQSDSISWVTAWNPGKQLLLGYVFKTAHYPWFNYWNHWENGEPQVRGLEFGSTGVGEPYEILLKDNKYFYGVPFYEYMDAGTSRTKSWLCFQVETDALLEKVLHIGVKDDHLEVEILDRQGQVETLTLTNAGRYFRE